MTINFLGLPNFEIVVRSVFRRCASDMEMLHGSDMCGHSDTMTENLKKDKNMSKICKTGKNKEIFVGFC